MEQQRAEGPEQQFQLEKRVSSALFSASGRADLAQAQRSSPGLVLAYSVARKRVTRGVVPAGELQLMPAAEMAHMMATTAQRRAQMALTGNKP